MTTRPLLSPTSSLPDREAAGQPRSADPQATETGMLAVVTPPTQPLGSVDGAEGERVGAYRLVRKLGEGGMASVYLAVHTATGAQVALKRVKASAREDKQFVERFVREMRAIQKLSHPHICRIFDGGDDGRDVYMAVELIGGGDVDALLRNLGGTMHKLPAAVAAVVICELLEALDHAHAHGVVHRDIKPANVMLTADGVVKLVDFGIARDVDQTKLTATGIVVGTPAYMSPEQVRGMPVDGRSDLFSVGVMLTELLTGNNPFVADNATATVMRILLEPLPPLFTLDPTIPGVLQKVVAGLTERDPQRRYPSARAALADLQPYRSFVDAESPGLLAACLRDPLGAARALWQKQARFEIDRAEDLEAMGEAGWPAAALALYRALRIDDSSDVRARFERLCKRAGFDFAPADPRVADVAAEVHKSPSQPALLKRAADVHRACKDPRGQADYLGRYLQVVPHDTLVARQWQVLVSGPPTTPSAATKVKLTTREIVDGIKTGGWKNAASATEGMTRAGALPAAAALAPAELGPTTTSQPAKRPPERREQAVVVVGAAEGSSGAARMFAAAAGVAVLAGAIAMFGWSTKETATATKQAFGTAERVGERAVEDGMRSQTQQHLLAARQAIAGRDADAALHEADLALQLDPSQSERAEALFIKARAFNSDDKLALARDALRDYFAAATSSHPDLFEARALQSQLDVRAGNSVGVGGGSR